MLVFLSRETSASSAASLDTTEPGAIGALLRREGLYSSHLTTWRQERADGINQAFSRKRGPKIRRDVTAEENARLRRQNERLTEELRKAHLIIDVQKKVAALLGRPIQTPDPENL